MEIAVIALPALLALAADPLASLVDTGFIGQIGIGRHVRTLARSRGVWCSGISGLAIMRL